MSPSCFLPNFESTGISVQEKKRKIDLQDGRHLRFLIGTTLAILIYKSSRCILPIFVSIGPLVKEKRQKKKKKKKKNEFQDGRHGGDFGVLIGTILAIFDLQVTLMLPTVLSQLAFWFRRRSEK